MNTPSADTFRILTQRDKARITAGLITLALAQENLSKLSNRALASKFGVSEYAIKTQKRLISGLGVIGIFKGEDISGMPKIPDTTWDRFHLTMHEAEAVMLDASQRGIETSYIKSLEAAYRAAKDTANEDGPSLNIIANATDLLDSVMALCK